MSFRSQALSLIACAMLLSLSACTDKQPDDPPSSISPTDALNNPTPDSQATEFAILRATMAATLLQAPTPTPTDRFPQTPYPTPTPGPSLTPFPTPPLVLADNSALPPGAVARVPPLTLPEWSEDDGQFVVRNDGGQAVRVYDTQTGDLLWSRRFSSRTYLSESPDERWVSGNVGDNYQVFEIATGIFHSELPATATEYMPQFSKWSPDNNLLILQNGETIEDAVLHLWNPDTDEIIYSITDQRVLLGDVFWSQDGQLLFMSNYAHGQADNEIVVRDAATGQRLREMIVSLGERNDGYPLSASIANLHISPDETILAATYGFSGGDTSFVPGWLIFWDVRTGERVAEIDYEGLWDVTFSPDGTRIAQIDNVVVPANNPDEPLVAVWSTETTDILYTIQSPFELTDFTSVTDVKWSPNGLVLAIVFNGHVTLWDGLTGEYFRELEGSASTVAWEDGGRILRSTDYIWNIVTGEIEDIPPPVSPSIPVVQDFQWTADGSGVWLSSADSVQLWSFPESDPLRPASFVRRFSLNAYLNPALSVSSDQSLLATVGNLNGEWETFRNYTIQVWNAQSGQLSSELTLGGSQYFLDVAFSPDGKWLAAAGETLVVWDAAENEVKLQVEGDNNRLGLAWDQASARLAVAGQSTVEVWDVIRGQILHTFTNPPSNYRSSGRELQAANTVAWSPDQRYLAAGFGDIAELPGYIIIWDVESGEQVKTLFEQPHSITDLAWSPDGTLLVASGGHSSWDQGGLGFTFFSSYTSLIVWDVQSGLPLTTLPGHIGAVRAVEFSPDGRWLASGSSDGSVLIWDPSFWR